jgi:phosphoglycerol transferase MdoB-like AlkP superfamily enzyme
LHWVGKLVNAKFPLVARGFRLSIIAILLITTADLLVLQQFFVRLTVGEIWKFIGEPQAIRGFLSQFPLASGLYAVSLGAVGIAIAWAYSRGSRFGVRVRYPYTVSSALVVGFIVTGASKVDDFHTTYLENATEVFFAYQSRHRDYTPEYSQKVPNRDSNSERCFDGLGLKPDVLLLVVESLSMYQSQYFSNIENWMPFLDDLAIRGRAYEGFHANGFISEQGLIALLNGEPPIEKPNAQGKTMFETFMSTQNSVPHMMQGAGYTTRFISAFNLDFPGLMPWLSAVGFEQIEGRESGFYKGKSTVNLHFDSWPDELLFDRIMDVLMAPRKAPLFITAFTQSTHHPYIDPRSGTRTQAAAFRYLDTELSRLVSGLRQQRFFENGLLLIVGDHRAMQPMGVKELENFGDRGFVRVPMVVYGKIAGTAVQGREKSPFSQTDLLPSLRYLVSPDRNCLAPDQGIFLPSTVATPECLYTLRSYNPNQVFVHCSNGSTAIKLDGDKTRITGQSTLTNREIDVINRLRLGRGF